MKKKIIKAAIVTISVTTMFVACSKKNVTPTSSSSPTVNETQTATNALAKGPSVGKTSFAFFAERAKANGNTLELAPAGYVPSKTGEWDYDQVYLFDQGNYKTLELYTFDDAAAKAFAQGSNNKDLWEDNNKIKCSGPGSLCGGGATPCIVLD
jgi:hypothetical protein